MKLASHLRLKKRLSAYSATAGAALAVSTTADAAIINISNPNVAIDFMNMGATVPFTAGPFNAYFVVNNRTSTGNQTGFVSFSVAHSGQTSARVAGSGGVVAKLSLGAAINPQFLTQGRFTVALRNVGNLGGAGYFLPNGGSAAATGYIGLKQGVGSTLKYGWMKIRVANSSQGFPAQFTFIAANGNPTVFGAWMDANDPDFPTFKVGDMAPVPEPSTSALGGLGLLALGAAGLREMRKRRKA